MAQLGGSQFQDAGTSVRGTETRLSELNRYRNRLTVSTPRAGQMNTS